MSCKGLLICLLVCFIAAGCSFFDPKPDPSGFSLWLPCRAPAREGRIPLEPTRLLLGIGPIKFPGYLDRQQFVTRISQNRFAVAENDHSGTAGREFFEGPLAKFINLASDRQNCRLPMGKKPTARVSKCRWKCFVLSPTRSSSSSCGPVGDHGRQKDRQLKESCLTQPARDKSTEASVAALRKPWPIRAEKLLALSAISLLEGGKILGLSNHKRKNLQKLICLIDTLAYVHLV